MRLQRAFAPFVLATLFSACGEDAADETPSDDMSSVDAGQPAHTTTVPGTDDPLPTATTTVAGTVAVPTAEPTAAPSASTLPEPMASAAEVTEQNDVSPEAGVPAEDAGTESVVEADGAAPESTSTVDASADAGGVDTPAHAINWIEGVAFVAGTPIEYGALDVPFDYAQPEGETFQLALARSRTLSSERAGVIMFNGGGPGPAIVYEAEVQLGWLREIFPTFDIVVMDNRGTGFSAPLDCFSLDEQVELDIAQAELMSEIEDEMKADGHVSEEEEAQLDMLSRGFIVKSLQTKCVEVYPSEISYYNSENVARDMESVRAALGEERLNFWGASYGTVQGSLYAKLYPEHVGAFALDSVVIRTEDGPNYIEDVVGAISAYEEQLNRFLDEEGQNPDSPLFQHPAGSPDVIFDDLNAELEQGVMLDGQLLPDFALSAISSGLLRQGNWTLLANFLYAAASDDWKGALELLPQGPDSEVAAEMDSIAGQALDVIHLTDMPCPAGYTPEKAESLYADVHVRYPRMARWLSDHLIDCQYWDLERSEPRLIASDLESPPLLVLNGLNDPATPYLDALAMVQLFNNGSRVVTGDIEGHGVGPSGLCGESVLNDFMLSADVNAAPEVCTDGGGDGAARKLRQLAARKTRKLALPLLRH